MVNHKQKMLIGSAKVLLVAVLLLTLLAGTASAQAINCKDRFIGNAMSANAVIDYQNQNNCLARGQSITCGGGGCTHYTVSCRGYIVRNSISLNSDLICDSTGLVAGADDITINCNGRTISFSTKYGLSNFYSTYDNNAIETRERFEGITFKNCNVISRGSRGVPVSLINSHSTRIEGGTFTSLGAPAIKIIGSTENVITGATLNGRIELTSVSESEIRGNTITTRSGTPIESGIRVQGNSADNEIADNIITTDGSGDYAHGIWLGISANKGNYISGNTITQKNRGFGIYVWNAKETTIVNNVITTAVNDAINLLFSSDSEIEGNTLKTTGQFASGITVDGPIQGLAKNNEIFDNIITSNGLGIRVRGATSHMIFNNEITVTGEEGQGILFLQGDKNWGADIASINHILSGNTINAETYIKTDDVSVGNTIRDTTFIAADGSGSVKVTGQVTIPGSTVIDSNTLSIALDTKADGRFKPVWADRISYPVPQVSIDQTALSFLKVPAEISVHVSNQLQNPVAALLSGAECSASECTEQTLVGRDFKFKVNALGTHTVVSKDLQQEGCPGEAVTAASCTLKGEGFIPRSSETDSLGCFLPAKCTGYPANAIEIDECGILDTPNGFYLLTKDVSTPTTCFDIRADGITLDCAGNKIIFAAEFRNSNRAAVYAKGRDSLKITNCNIEDGKQEGSNFLKYNIVQPNHTAINFQEVSNSEIFGNTFETTKSGPIILSTWSRSLGESSGVKIHDNNISAGGIFSQSIYGIGPVSTAVHGGEEIYNNKLNSTAGGIIADYTTIIRENEIHSTGIGIYVLRDAGSSLILSDYSNELPPVSISLDGGTGRSISFIAGRGYSCPSQYFGNVRIDDCTKKGQVYVAATYSSIGCQTRASYCREKTDTDLIKGSAEPGPGGEVGSGTGTGTQPPVTTRVKSDPTQPPVRKPITLPAIPTSITGTGVLITQNNITVKSFGGIVLDNINNSQITENRINLTSAQMPAIYLNVSGSGNIIKNNIIELKSGTHKAIGISLTDTSRSTPSTVFSHNQIIGNIIRSTGQYNKGIFISPGLTYRNPDGQYRNIDLQIKGNYILDNEISVASSGGVGIYLGLSEYTQFAISGIDNNVISGNIISTQGGRTYGILLTGGPNENTISYNTLVASCAGCSGIHLVGAYSNTLEGNDITILGRPSSDSKSNGILIQQKDPYQSYPSQGAGDNIITGNKVYANGRNTHGIVLRGSGNSQITFNRINTTNDQSHGLSLEGSSGNNIFSNIISEHAMENIIPPLVGIRYSGGCFRLTPEDCSSAIHLKGSSGNEITNNIFNRTSGSNAYDNGGNKWNDERSKGNGKKNIIAGPNQGGNFYGTYIDVDRDGDGFGESVQKITGSSSVDALPLADPARIGKILDGTTAFENKIKNLAGKVTIKFTPPNDIPTDGVIRFTFPAGFDVSKNSLIGGSCGNLPGKIRRSTDTINNVIALQRIGNPKEGLESRNVPSISCTFRRIINPRNPIDASDIQIEILDSSFNLVSIGTAPVTEITPTGQLTEVKVIQDTYEVGGVGTVFVSFRTNNVIPPGGRIKITFPSGYDISGVGPALEAIFDADPEAAPCGLTGSGRYRVDPESRTLEIRRDAGDGDSLPVLAGTKLVCVIPDVKNPTEPVLMTDPYLVETRALGRSG